MLFTATTQITAFFTTSPDDPYDPNLMIELFQSDFYPKGLCGITKKVNHINYDLKVI